MKKKTKGTAVKGGVIKLNRQKLQNYLSNKEFEIRKLVKSKSHKSVKQSDKKTYLSKVINFNNSTFFLKLNSQLYSNLISKNSSRRSKEVQKPLSPKINKFYSKIQKIGKKQSNNKNQSPQLTNSKKFKYNKIYKTRQETIRLQKNQQNSLIINSSQIVVLKYLIIQLRYKEYKIQFKIPWNISFEVLRQQAFKLLIKKTNIPSKKLQNFSGFASLDKDLFIDYWINQLNQKIGIFSDIQKIEIKPLFQLNDKHIGIDQYEIFQQLGSGGFSKVFLGKRKTTLKFYALKFISKSFIKNNKKQDLLMNERQILTKVNHPFIIDLKECFELENYIVFVIDYCPNGQLYNYITKSVTLSQEEARYYFIQILLGIQALHANKIIYRDIKLENILFDAKGHIKIIDFGLSKPNIEKGDIAYSYCGSPQYMAPQMLLKYNNLNRKGHSFQIDFYCLGVLLYQMIFGYSPFTAQTKEQIYYSALNNQVTFPNSQQISNELKILIKGLLRKDPKKRVGSLNGVKEILAHPWCRKLNYKEILEMQTQSPFRKLNKICSVQNDI